MSTDNGIYILALKDEYRVIETNAIENLYWSFENQGGEKREINPALVYTYYKNVESFKNEEDAYEKALEIEDNIYDDGGYCEYGINTMRELQKHTWEEVKQLAKEQAKKEIEWINQMPHKDNRWDFEKKEMEAIIKE